MRQADYARVSRLWRREKLAVCSSDGQCLATVERGAVRALGITTHGVHLHGYTRNQGVWVQQRALNKATDPGRWDTLMGGMVPASDSLAEALARETYEEAGLPLNQIQSLHLVDHFTIRTPSASDSGLGYVVERIDWFEGVLPMHVAPVNRDGEVQQFRRIDSRTLCQMLMHGDFTTEASVILGRSLLGYRSSNDF
jgi:8-oxo-dGTP pyrophosphatase MutT (NUDIX family)